LARRNASRWAACAAFLALGWVGCAGGPTLDGVEGLFGGAGLSGESRLVAGLKQALEVGTERAVSQTSRSGGFTGDPAIRIGLPESLDKMAIGLRAIGFGAKVDELELAMNRAAEKASAEAADVFVQGIRQLTISDAQAILAGGDTAATEFFERTTREPLGQRFEPIVAEQMQGIGVVEQYNSPVDRYAALPFTKPPVLDVESYVTGEALDGLFHVLGNEERRIREDPAARSTELLREVFQ
jgi:hypothetical protein